MNGDHFDAVIARLREADALSDKTYDAIRVDDSGKLVRDAYAVLYGGSPDDLDDDRFTAPQTPASRRTHVYTVRSVGPDADAARAVADHVSGQLVRAVVPVSGRRSDPIRLTRGGELQTDESVTPPLCFIDDEYTLVTYPL